MEQSKIVPVPRRHCENTRVVNLKVKTGGKNNTLYISKNAVSDRAAKGVVILLVTTTIFFPPSLAHREKIRRDRGAVASVAKQILFSTSTAIDKLRICDIVGVISSTVFLREIRPTRDSYR